MMVWSQVYDPLNNAWISTAVAALPVIVLLGALGIFRVKAHVAALLGLAVSLASAILIFGMPASMAAKTALLGAAFGLLPIGWIILNIIFLYRLTERLGLFKVLQDSISGITDDRRLQLLLIAFCFGAFFEGAAGFGTPVAVTGAILIGLGFAPLAASGLSLIANTAPVAYGALGSPVLALAAVTGLPLLDLSTMIGRQLPVFSMIVPFWLIVAFAGWRGTLQIWPAILVAGVSFAIPQFLVSNFHGPWLVDVVASLVSMASLTLFLKCWQPVTIWTTLDRHAVAAHSAGAAATREATAVPAKPNHPPAQVRRAWLPWIILSVIVFVWGLPAVKAFLDGISIFRFPIDGLNNMIQRVPPVVAKPHAEAAVYIFNWLSMTGTGILISALIAGKLIGASFRTMVEVYWETLIRVRYSLLTIAAMLALGYTTRYSGLDATLGLAFAHTGIPLPLLRYAARLDRRRPDRLRHRLKRVVRQLTADFVRAARPEPHPDGSRQQFRRGNGQNDRRAEHCRCGDGDQLSRTRGGHPAIRLLPLDCPRLPGRRACHTSGLRLAVRRHGGQSLSERQKTSRCSDPASRQDESSQQTLAAAAREEACA
jgi:lactate permease